VNFESFGGRRFIFTLITLAVIAVMRWNDKLPPAEFSSILEWLGTAYVGANTLQKFIDRK
jgi:hypothetical protein